VAKPVVTTLVNPIKTAQKIETEVAKLPGGTTVNKILKAAVDPAAQLKEVKKVVGAIVKGGGGGGGGGGGSSAAAPAGSCNYSYTDSAGVPVYTDSSGATYTSSSGMTPATDCTPYTPVSAATSGTSITAEEAGDDDGTDTGDDGSAGASSDAPVYIYTDTDGDDIYADPTIPAGQSPYTDVSGNPLTPSSTPAVGTVNADSSGAYTYTDTDGDDIYASGDGTYDANGNAVSRGHHHHREPGAAADRWRAPGAAHGLTHVPAGLIPAARARPQRPG
jgi:hypothetical protein